MSLEAVSQNLVLPVVDIASAEANSFEEIAGLKMALQATGAGNLIILETIDMNQIAKNAAKAIGNYTPPAKT